jgi:Asp-tRNA(Asn)/Glu-tRNA(Gln) amidotransferase A subunit family amidase
MPITELDSNLSTIATRLARNDYSSTDLTKYYLDQIALLDGKLHSYINVMAESALRDAHQADRQRSNACVRGALHGIPFAVKDVYDAQGEVTTGGSPAFRDKVAERDATVIARLRESGAILLGKLATHELTHGGVDFGLPWPPARNPWNVDYDPGGSSSGPGAAVAAGLCAFALGTDTGGSIRKPAGMCGIAGLKPTFGRVSRFGVMLNAASLDHCGPMAHTAADCSIVLQAIAGPDPLDPNSASEKVPDYSSAIGKGIAGTQIGVVSHFWTEDLPASPVMHDGMEQAIEVLKRLGAEIRDVRLKPISEYAAVKVTIQRFELFAAYGHDIRSRRTQFGPNIRNRMDDYELITVEDYRAAKQRQIELTADMVRAMAKTDVLITAGPGPAALLADVTARSRPPPADLTLPFNLTGFPAIATCIGFTDRNLPFSMQIVGRPFDECAVLRVATAYERATQWHRRHPDMQWRAHEASVV